MNIPNLTISLSALAVLIGTMSGTMASAGCMLCPDGHVTCLRKTLSLLSSAVLGPSKRLFRFKIPSWICPSELIPLFCTISPYHWATRQKLASIRFSIFDKFELQQLTAVMGSTLTVLRVFPMCWNPTWIAKVYRAKFLASWSEVSLAQYLTVPSGSGRNDCRCPLWKNYASGLILP